MRYIIDTQVFIWYAVGDKQLSKSAIDIIESDALCYVSIASIWEMTIKNSIGKLTFHVPFEALIKEQIELNKYEILPIELAHVFQISNLPFYHKDPFDRILIAQAVAEDIPIISIDSYFRNYPINVIW